MFAEDDSHVNMIGQVHALYRVVLVGSLLNAVIPHVHTCMWLWPIPMS